MSESEIGQDAAFEYGKSLYGHPDFYKLLAQMGELHSRKNADYAGDEPLRNLKAASRIGLEPFIGVLVRMQDKMTRIEEFAKKDVLEVADEKIEDTLMDLAVYALLGIIIRRDAKEAGKRG